MAKIAIEIEEPNADFINLEDVGRLLTGLLALKMFKDNVIKEGDDTTPFFSITAGTLKLTMHVARPKQNCRPERVEHSIQ